MKIRKREAAVCEQCGGEYQRRTDQRTQRFCSLTCKGAWQRAQPHTWQGDTIRRLRDDEPLPDSEPRRYLAGNGYAVLRWKVGVASYVEALEHRVVAGRTKRQVHHINRIRDDNRPENLKSVTSLEHGTEHSTWDVDAACALYRAGWSLPRLSAFFGKGNVHIMRALKRRGVVMRTIQQAWVLRKAR